MKPGCPCTEFQVEVLRANGGTVGMVEAETAKWQGRKLTKDPFALSLWQNFMRDPHARKSLDKRRRNVR
jgi:hypothetical protein